MAVRAKASRMKPGLPGARSVAEDRLQTLSTRGRHFEYSKSAKQHRLMEEHNHELAKENSRPNRFLRSVRWRRSLRMPAGEGCRCGIGRLKCGVVGRNQYHQ